MLIVVVEVRVRIGLPALGTLLGFPLVNVEGEPSPVAHTIPL